MPTHKTIAFVFGESILFASMQFAIGSVEMSSKFSVKNFSTNQETLNHASDALGDYIIIGILWMIGTSLVFYNNYHLTGLLCNLVSNTIIMLWIVISYEKAFKYAARKGNLEMPKLFRKKGAFV